MAKMWNSLAGLFDAITALVTAATEKLKKDIEDDAPKT